MDSIIDSYTTPLIFFSERGHDEPIAPSLQAHFVDVNQGALHDFHLVVGVKGVHCVLVCDSVYRSQERKLQQWSRHKHKFYLWLSEKIK